MERVPEPELMLDDAQALAYARADFEEPHERFVALLCEKLPELPATGAALDLGCGPGDVTLRVARQLEGWTVDGLDGSPAMLALARDAATRGGLARRVRFETAHLPAGSPPRERYDLVFSNSLLHHLADPAVLWSASRRWAGDLGRLFAMDLLRPESREAAAALVERHAAREPEVLRRDFLHSLCAAYREDELAHQLRDAGLEHLERAVVSDRHWIAWGPVRPSAGR